MNITLAAVLVKNFIFMLTEPVVSVIMKLSL